MKNLVLMLVVGFIFLVGCKGPKEITKSASTEKIEAVLMPFTQAYLHDLSPEDSVICLNNTYFRNSCQIVISLRIFQPHKPFKVENGIPCKQNNDVIVIRKVLKMTPGNIKDVKFYKSNPKVMLALLVSFDQGDATYQLQFFRREDGTFTLSAKAKMLYDGKSYDVDATVSSSEDCILVFYGDEKKDPKVDEDNAKGINVGSSANASTSTKESVGANTGSSPIPANGQEPKKQLDNHEFLFGTTSPTQVVEKKTDEVKTPPSAPAEQSVVTDVKNPPNPPVQKKQVKKK